MLNNNFRYISEISVIISESIIQQKDLGYFLIVFLLQRLMNITFSIFFLSFHQECIKIMKNIPRILF